MENNNHIGRIHFPELLEELLKYNPKPKANMNNQYYTPEIEEFHVGFEYEFKHPENIEWIKYNTPELNHEKEDFALCEYGREEFRVKYLNKEDIESLGWTWINDRGMQENNGDLFKMIYKDGYVLEAELRIWYPLQTFWRGRRVEIKTGRNTSNFYLKNKSELKLLMEQLQLEKYEKQTT